MESPRYSVESRPYSVESAPKKPATAWYQREPAFLNLGSARRVAKGAMRTLHWRMAPTPPGGATRRQGNADLWPVLPVGAGTARRRRAAGPPLESPRYPATAWSQRQQTPLQRGALPTLQRGVSASRPRYSYSHSLQRGVSANRTRYSVESHPSSVESAPAEPATAWSRTPPAWSQRQQNPLQRGVTPLQRGVSASRPRYSVETSRPYSVESAPTSGTGANPLQRGGGRHSPPKAGGGKVTRLQRGASSANPHFSTSGALAESHPHFSRRQSQKAPRGRCTGAWRPPHRAERRAGKGTPTSGQFSRWGPAQPAEGGRREGPPAGVAPLQRGVAPLQRGVSTSRPRSSVVSRRYSVESAPAEPPTAWSQRQQNALPRGVPADTAAAPA